MSPWLGFLPAVSGTGITAGFAWLMVDRFRHTRAAPEPDQLPARPAGIH